tara:strand:+ start:547 stop:987 length:441 start_codon:yes stop_codon:yes gene_type:complete
MTTLEIAELISLAATFPALILSICVVVHWRKEALQFRFSQSSAVEWFILGVAIGFTGAAIDNLYWMIPWTLKFLNHESADSWVDRGVYFNIPFRQFAGALSAYCHVRAAYTYAGSGKGRVKVNDILAYSILAGLIYAIILLYYPIF